MYIHVVRSGSCNQYIKQLLREGRREGQHIRNRTILNISNWSANRIKRLKDALEMKRKHRGTGTILERQADSWILNVIGEHGWERTDLMWQLLCSLPAKHPVGSRGGMVTAPNGVSEQHSQLTTITEDEATQWMTPGHPVLKSFTSV